MVIGNGFFTDDIDAAVVEMQTRSKCEVRHLPYPTVGNIDYYVSRSGDLYGVQRIANRFITRRKSHLRYKGGFTARLMESPHKETFVHLGLLTYCAFVLGEWKPGVKLEFKNGDCYDVRPENLCEAVKSVVVEYAERMACRKNIYGSQFGRVCWSVNYTTGLPIEDCKDVTQNTFIYLTTTGHRSCIRTEDDFIGLWIKVARLRAIDYQKHRWHEFPHEMDWLPSGSRTTFEFDFFGLQPGKKRQQYLRLYFEGNSPTEIARECGASLGTVSSSVSRSIQFMQKYFKRDIEQWNRRR